MANALTVVADENMVQELKGLVSDPSYMDIKDRLAATLKTARRSKKRLASRRFFGGKSKLGENIMKNLCLAMVSFCILALNFVSYAAIIDDGLTHYIDYAVDDTLYVYDSSAGGSTHINISGGAVFSAGAVFDGHSRLDMTGGFITSVVNEVGFWMQGNSVASISSGFATYCTLKGDSVTTISGDAGMFCCHVIENATAVIDADSIGNLWVYDSASVTILGGEFDAANAWTSSHLDISGGRFIRTGDIGSEDGCISGGTFDEALRLRGAFEISGGNFNEFIFTPSSSLTFVGSDFAINGQVVTPGDTVSDWNLSEVEYMQLPHLTGVLTGVLADGTQINQNIYFEDSRRYGLDLAEIYFVPEPASMWFLLAGCGLLVRKNRWC